MDDAHFVEQLRRVLGPEPADAVLAALEGSGEGAFVGGWVRDALIARDSDDVDLAVPDPAELEQALRATGLLRKTVVMDEARDTRRLVFSGGRYVDVARLRGSLVDDLKLRDLRINAMAWLPGRGGLDPLDGRWDLDQRTLRFASPRALIDDPLRALRLWRFALELDARPAEPLPAVDLSEIAPERSRAELARILTHPRCAEALGDLDRAGVLAQVLPGVLRPRLLRGTRRGRVIGRAVARCLEYVAARPDGLLGVRLGWLCEHPSLETELVARRWPRRIARMAAATGAEVGREPGDRPRELIAWDGRIAWALLGRAADADEPEAAVAPYLALLDAAAGRPDDGAQVPGLPAPLLPSTEIGELLGLEPGPALGQRVAALVEAQLRGEVGDVESARSWLC